VSALRACPFCRTLYRPDEGQVCAECGVALVPMHTLGPSHDALLEEPPVTVLPEDEPLPWHEWRYGRGALLALSVLGLGLFFAPWVEVIKPESVVRSGYDLARGRAGWLWGGASGYLVLLPLVFTRRTISRLRGVRLVCVLLASLSLCEATMLMALPPRGHGLMPVAIEWLPGLYASAFVSLLATIAGARLGGPSPKPKAASPPPATPARERDGHTLH
jgi:hypothetical protein